ncbi:MAG: diguanylate cyclase [Gemmataceae bacterium]
MLCQHAQRLLNENREGTDEGQDADLGRHLADCPRCQRFHEALTRRPEPGFASCSLLIVDDEPHILTTLRHLLEREFEVLTAPSADAAEATLRDREVQLLLVDQHLPGRRGTDLLAWARQNRPRTIRLLMTGRGDTDDVIAAINSGQVYSYLPKPWSLTDLHHLLRNAADRWHLERKQEEYVEELRRLNEELERRVAERTRQLEEANQQLQQHNRELERLALTDPLTGLFNRRAIEDQARFELRRQTRYPTSLALGVLDIDHFKAVNTRYLLTGGDEVLKALARTLTATVREVDTVGRIGGEEFAILACETNIQGAATLAERLRATVAATPIVYNGQEIRITVSVGFAVVGVGLRSDYEGLFALAAAALADAKQNGRNRSEIRSVTTAQAS